MKAVLPETLNAAVAARLESAPAEAWPRRLWQGDAALWTGREEGKWLGWLAAAKGEQVDPGALAAFSVEARGYDDAVLLGMGGSFRRPRRPRHDAAACARARGW